MNSRAVAFISVGMLGFVVQMTVLGTLCLLLRWPIAAATAVAVEAAMLTNFVWHERWTWRDRAINERRSARLVRFHVSNGITSLVGNTILTVLFATGFGLNPIVGNILSVGLLSVVNYLAADRWVFGKPAAVALIIVATPWPAGAAELTPTAIDSWNRYVAATEASLPQHERDAPLSEPQGRSIEVDGATIHEWRGSTLVQGVTVNQLIDGLRTPGFKQEDVAESRLLEQQGDSLRVYLKLVRRVGVTVTYDTEHDVQYVRRSAGFATSRSVSTRIVETGGSDQGFLWRLNSYWRYRQVGNDVQVDVLSLSLSRNIPWVVRAAAQPLINRIGRESMYRTLDAVAKSASFGS